MKESDAPSAGGQDYWSAGSEYGFPTKREQTIAAAGPPPDPAEHDYEIAPTGISECDAAGYVDGVHVLGVLHSQPLAITRVVGAIRRYEPEVVAIEASREAVHQYHPDVEDPRWPPDNELEAAAFMTVHDDELLIAAIDTLDHDQYQAFVKHDREIFTDLGIIESDEELTLDTYYSLDIDAIQSWRRLTESRIPTEYEEVIANRDVVMAGHLRGIVEDDSVDTVVAAVGMQHVTGVLDWLAAPTRIPDSLVTLPPVSAYHTI